MRKLRSVIAAALIGAGFLGSFASLGEAAAVKVKLKIAIVDVERCINESEDGLRAAASLKKFRDRQQLVIQTLEFRLKQQQEELQRLSEKGFTPEVGEKARLFKKDLEDYNLLLRRANEIIARREDELYGPIERKLKAIMARIAESDGWDMILDKKHVPMISGERDLTSRVIREYDWGVGSAASASASASSKS